MIIALCVADQGIIYSSTAENLIKDLALRVRTEMTIIGRRYQLSAGEHNGECDRKPLFPLSQPKTSDGGKEGTRH